MEMYECDKCGEVWLPYQVVADELGIKRCGCGGEATAIFGPDEEEREQTIEEWANDVENRRKVQRDAKLDLRTAMAQDIRKLISQETESLETHDLGGPSGPREFDRMVAYVDGLRSALQVIVGTRE